MNYLQMVKRRKFQEQVVAALRRGIERDKRRLRDKERLLRRVESEKWELADGRTAD